MEAARDQGFIQEQTMNRLTKQYQTDLLRMCYLYLHDAELARDAVQETYLKAWRALASPQGIDAQASQGSVAPLTERSDETFSVGQFSSADWE